jgi:hypothetical protein
MTAAGAADTSGSLGAELFGPRARQRGRPAISDALAALGGVAIGAGVLLITIDIRLHHSSTIANVALFLGLVLIGFVVVNFLPATVHPAGIALIAIGVFGTFGWWLLPHAHSWSHIRIFLVLTIAGYIACFVAPRARGRSIFVALILILAWLWILGEVVGPGASYSAAPIPSPPAHTIFSLSVLHRQTQVSIDDLDPTDPLYSTAQTCDDGDMSACDQLYHEAPAGSDFQQFGAQCGSRDSTGGGGNCVLDNGGSGSSSIVGSAGSGTFPNGVNPLPSSLNPANDVRHKETEVGLISLLFGLAYLFGLFLLDERGYPGLATAFVVPCALALYSGTQVLGAASHHLWVGGALTFIAGLVFGVIGEVEERRFTAWFGAVACGYGLIIISSQATDWTHQSTTTHQLLKPGFATIATGLILVAIGALLAVWLASRRGGPSVAAAPNGPVPPGTPAPVPSPMPAPVPVPVTAPMTAPMTAPAPAPAPPAPIAPVPTPTDPGRSPWAPPDASPSQPAAPPSWGAPPPPPPPEAHETAPEPEATPPASAPAPPPPSWPPRPPDGAS